MLDYHVHLARLPEPERLCRELESRDYHAILVACEPWEWDIAETLTKRFPKMLTPCFGIHPKIAQDVDDLQLRHLEALLRKYPQALVGECGIDKRFPTYTAKEIQEELFLYQAKLSIELSRPLMLHVVGDFRRILTILENLHFPQKNAIPIFHRFCGDVEIAVRAQKLNAQFSIHKDSLRKKSTRKALLKIPHAAIRFETDADESFSIGNKKTPEETADSLIDALLAVKNSFDSLNRLKCNQSSSLPEFS